jgi:hypothetical protein
MYAALVGAGWLPRYDGLLFFALCSWIAHIRARSDSRRTALYVAFLATVTVGGLSNMWWSYGGVADRQGLLGDVIPWSDAGGYLSDATRRNYGLLLGQAARRPLYLVVLAALLRVTGDDVRAVVAMMALATTVLGAMVASRIAERTRPWGAALALVVIYSFIRRHSFSLSTESFGFVFGAAAFLVLFRSDASLSDLFAGTLLFALGLATRMGPLFVVFTTVLVFGARRQWLRALAVMCAWALVLVGDAWLLSKVRATGVAMGDYGPILYGMLHGEDFTFISTAHPELATVPVAHRGAAIVSIVLSELSRQPTLAVVGPVRSVASFLFLPHGLLSFVLYNPDDIFLESPLPPRGLVAAMVGGVGIYRTVSYGVMLLTACGVAIVFLYSLSRLFVRKASDPAVQFCGAVFLGVVISSAFTPPWITEGEQLQSSTLPFLAAFAACSLGTSDFQDEASSRCRLGYAPCASAVGTLVFLIACAFLPARWARAAPGCPDDAGSSVLFARAMAPTRVDVSDSTLGYSMDRVRTNAKYLMRHHADLGRPLLELAAPHMAFEVVYDRCEERTRIVAGDIDLLMRWGSHWAMVDVEPHDGILRALRIREIR